MVDITIVNGVYKPSYNWGAPSCIQSDLPSIQRCWFDIALIHRNHEWPMVPCLVDPFKNAVFTSTIIQLQIIIILKLHVYTHVYIYIIHIYIYVYLYIRVYIYTFTHMYVIYVYLGLWDAHPSIPDRVHGKSEIPSLTSPKDPAVNCDCIPVL